MLDKIISQKPYFELPSFLVEKKIDKAWVEVGGSRSAEVETESKRLAREAETSEDVSRLWDQLDVSLGASLKSSAENQAHWHWGSSNFRVETVVSTPCKSHVFAQQ